MIKVIDIYNELRETADEVVKSLQLANVRFDPALVLGLSQQIMMLRMLERYKISDAAQEALTKLVKAEKPFGCPIVGCKEPLPHIHAQDVLHPQGAKND